MNISSNMVDRVIEKSIDNLKDILAEKGRAEKVIKDRIQQLYKDTNKQVSDITITWKKDRTCKIDLEIGI